MTKYTSPAGSEEILSRRKTFPLTRPKPDSKHPAPGGPGKQAAVTNLLPLIWGPQIRGSVAGRRPATPANREP